MSDSVQLVGPKNFGTTIRKSFVDNFDRQIPGPGQYSPQRLDNILNPEWIIGTSQDRNSFTQPQKAKNPCPQQYHINYSSIQKQPKKYSIPLGKVDSKTFQTIKPMYSPNIEPTRKQNPHYSFGYSQQIDFDNKLPGVGSYELQTDSNSFNKTQNLFGTGDRPLPYGEQGKFPGSTKYDTQGFNNTAKFSFARTERQVKRKNPSPLAKIYDISPKAKPTRNNRFYDLKVKKRQTMLFVLNENPSPSHYNPYEHTNTHGGVIEYSKRLPLEDRSVVAYPSPDKYAGDQVVRNNKKGYGFFKQPRTFSLRQNCCPGPGTYQPMKTLSSIGGSMRKVLTKKQFEKEPFTTPAANQYRPKITNTKHKAQSTIVFRSQRCDFSKTITGSIGPGDYELSPKVQGQLGKIGQSKRAQLNSTSRNPGVGDYNIPSTIGRLPKYYTSPKKMNQNGFSTFHQKLRLKMLQRQRNKDLQSVMLQQKYQLDHLHISPAESQTS